MIYITGDVHADLKDFQNRPFKSIHKNDVVIVCGDFGILWDGSKAELSHIKRIGRKRHKTVFVDGAHENFDLLDQYPVTEWCGGKVQVLSRNLMRLCRGQVFEIGGKKFFVFGGGESDDKELRKEHESWWPQEMPAQVELDEGLANLEKNNWQVDYILSYDVPSSFKNLMEPEETRINYLNAYFDMIREKCKYSKWIFGNYHRNKKLAYNIEAVYNGVLKID